MPLLANSIPSRAADVVIIGGGLGGCAAAIAAAGHGLRVIMTEETDWIGGQLTSQGVPPDEHQWIETKGANRSYRKLRSRLRAYYRARYPLTEDARQDPRLNPGKGSVSRLCAEPRAWLDVLHQWLAPFERSGQVRVLREHVPTGAALERGWINSVNVLSTRTGDQLVLVGRYFVDATELGELLPLTDAEFVIGSEAQTDTNELHASESARPENQQAFTVCFAMEHRAGEDHTMERPRDYDFWRELVPGLSPPWPGRLLDFTYTHPRTGMPKRLAFDPDCGPIPVDTVNLWSYRRIIDRRLFQAGRFASDISLVNWPQNDFLLGNLVGVSAEAAARNVEQARQLSRSLLYWLQTEAPRPDGRTGFPGLRMRGDVMGTSDGLAKAPYVRESRRIRAEFTVLEEHVGRENRSAVTGQPLNDVTAAVFADSVGVGSYAIDLHPTSGGDNYIDFESLPFQIPLGALLPVRVENLLPACKNIGTTHVTNGCYRLHPVEWGIGEAVGHLVAFALEKRERPRAIRNTPQLLADFQRLLVRQGVEIAWKSTN